MYTFINQKVPHVCYRQASHRTYPQPLNLQDRGSKIIARKTSPFARCFTLHDEVGHPENVKTTNGTMLRHLMPTPVAKSSALAALLDTNVLDAIQSSGKVAPYLLYVLR